MRLAILEGKKDITFQHNRLLKMVNIPFGGIVKEVSLKFFADAEMYNYVMAIVVAAIREVNEEAAQNTFNYFEEMDGLGELDYVKDYHLKTT